MKSYHARLKGILHTLAFVAVIFSAISPSTAQNTRESVENKAAAQGEKSAKPAGKQQQFVSIDFNNVDINVFIKFISELTGTNFVVDDQIKGKVTIISPAKISVDEAYKVFESVLEVHGFATVKAGEIVKIVPSPDARSKNIETLLKEEAVSPADKVVTQIIPLRYADANEIKRLFAPLISKSSVLLAYPPTNMLIITDVYSNIKRLLRILKAIDVTGIGREISVVPLQHADAANLAKLLGSVFQPVRRTPKGQQPIEETELPVLFVADDRTNTIVLLASEYDTERIKKLIYLLDKEMPRGTEKIRVYYLEHASAEDLATVLLALPTKAKGAKPTEGKKEAPVVSEKVQITADKATNSLIIMAEKDDYIVLEEVIKKLDIPRAMVYIEALIMEVSVDKDFRIGTEWIVGGKTDLNSKTGVIGGGFSGGAAGGDPGISFSASPFPPGFSLGVFSEESLQIQTALGTISFPNIGAVVQAYKKDKDVDILSTPQILTTDNEEATITVGKNIPFQTRSAAESGVETYSSYEYRDVGKTLKITPQISKDRMVRLNISLEVTDLESTADFRPTTLKRTVNTTVIVQDKSTVVIGGLIDETLSATKYQTPCLGQIPGAGWLFRSEGRANSKTNLFVFLTPRVVQNPDEAKGIYTNKKEQIEEIQEGKIKMYERNPKK